MNKHTFACYQENLTELLGQLREQNLFEFKDPSLWNRLVKILRIKPQEHFILFNTYIHVELIAHEKMFSEKRTIVGAIFKKIINVPVAPTLTLLLPVLKKEALEYASYVAAQMGVQEIVPVITEKSGSKITDKEQSRLQKVMISACEQSKNFIPPTLLKAQPLSQAIQQSNDYKICFDEHGNHLSLFVDTFKQASNKTFLIALGPEGGFVELEKKSLHTAGFTFYALTPTILRSREAVTVGLGILRGITAPQRSAS
ncbi:RNA methyltransferase [Candidatus Dependentiae bacterium]|nr:RNA methyltransferase [Candidatus Dependentiae bacterium]